MISLSSRTATLNESETIAMTRKSQELKDKGIDIINLSLGEPDFPTPDHIKAAGRRAIDNNFSHYSPIAGYPALRQAIVHKLKQENQLDYESKNILVSNGAKQAIANVLFAVLNPGDEVILPCPYWVSYREMVKLAGGTNVFIRAGIEQDFKFTPKQLEEVITPASRVLIVNSPSNPTGSVYTKQELKALVEVIQQHPHLLVISDEVYEHILYEGQHHSMACFDEIKEQTVVINGVSKSFAMTGWRIGYMAGPEWLVKACTTIQGQVTSGACSIAQMAALEALEGGLTSTRKMCATFRVRRDIVVDECRKIAGIQVLEPHGSFYLFPDVSALFGKSFNGVHISNADDLSWYLLETAHVATVPGEAFGAPECIRLCYAAGSDQLKEAMRRIQKALK